MTRQTAHTAMLTDEKIQELKPQILQALQARFPDMGITDIFLRSDTAYDGDPILRVYIGFRGKMPTGIVLRAKIIGIVSRILLQDGIEDFPSPTLMDATEFQKEQAGNKFYAIA